jgi:Family of unknown function (DUF5522)
VAEPRRPLSEPHPSRLASHHPMRQAILAVHEAARAAGEPGDCDPDTLFEFTAAYLFERGLCCEQGCRHCPYV